MVYSCSCSTFILYVTVNSGIAFYLILGSLLTFWGSNGLFWVGVGFDNCFQIVEQYLFSMFLSILTF